jgi:serine/threonine-protein kinase
MSPEQVRTPKSVDMRSDIWSLGTILYELLIGDLPFRGSNALDLLAAVASDPMPSIRQRRPDVTPELEAVIAKCLEKKPSDRYESVAAFATALAPHAPPSSRSYVSRISGIQRGPVITPIAGALAEGGTLRSTPASHPGSHSGSVHPSITPPAGDKRTVTDFGRSQASKARPRPRLLVAAGVALLCFGVALWLLGARHGASVEDSKNAAPVPPPPEPPPAALAPPATETPTVAPVPSTPSVAIPSAESGAVLPSSALKTSRKPAGAAPTHHAAGPVAAPTEASPKAKPPGSDPLDGRR